ncbi:MAG: hypothetical protein V4720_10600 [Pseudomonadota bacterium]
MPKGSQFEELAAKAAENIEAARAAGQQLTFLPDEAVPAVAGGRAPRGKGKVTSQLRDWCTAKGFRLPEDVLIEMAGMATREDAFLVAMQRTEQVLAWAEAGARQTATGVRDGVLVTIDLDTSATMAQRLAAFQFIFTAQLRAAEALLPYGLGKVTPDAPAIVPVPVYVASPAQGAAPVRAGDQARDVTPQDRRISPPPMPMAGQRNQGLSGDVALQSDAESRTE